MSPGTRRFETSAFAALAPVLTLAPVCLAALFVFWLPVRLVAQSAWRYASSANSTPSGEVGVVVEPGI
jgi:hypothetical protein